MKYLNLSQAVLAKIKEEHIKPRPKWQFTFKNVLVWITSAIALVFGGLSSSVVIYMLVNNDWDVYEHITGSLAGFIFVTMPYYWLVFMAIFCLSYSSITSFSYNNSLLLLVDST